MIQQYSEPAWGRGSKRRNAVDQVVRTVKRLHHDASDTEIVSPDLLDELRIMNAFNPNPACLGDLCLAHPNLDRAGCGKTFRWGLHPSSRDELNRFSSVQQDPTVGLELVKVAILITEDDALLLGKPDDGSGHTGRAMGQLETGGDFECRISLGCGVVADYIGRSPGVLGWHVARVPTGTTCRRDLGGALLALFLVLVFFVLTGGVVRFSGTIIILTRSSR